MSNRLATYGDGERAAQDRGLWTLERSAQIELADRGLGALTGWAVAALIVTSLLAALLAMADVDVTFKALAAFAVGSLVIVLVGECALCLAGIERIAARPLVAVVVGSSLTSIVLVAGVLLSGRTAGETFLCWGLLVLAVAIAIRKRLAASEAASSLDLFAMGSIALVIAFGCRGAAEAVPTLETTGALPVWIDYYIHAATMAGFGNPLAVGRGEMLMVGEPLIFYHYGSYQLAAAAMSVIDDASALTIATSVLIPLGLFLAALSIYALTSEMADRRAGVLALAILILAPDASHYGLENGFFGFLWLSFTNPGVGYGLAACAAALAMLVIWFRTANWRALALLAILLVAAFQFRAHFFLWLMPAILGTLILATPVARRHPLTLWVIGLLLLAVLIGALVGIEPVQRFWLGHSVVVDYLNAVHRGQEPTAYAGVYTYLIKELGQMAAIFAGIALILPAMLGIFVLAYPLALAYTLRTRGWHPIDAVPLLLLCVFFLVTLLAPAVAWGDITEYQHRSFVLLYMVIVIWTSVYVVRALPSTAERPVWIGAGLAGVALGAVGLVTVGGVNPAAPRFEWGKRYFNVPINPSIARAAGEIRRRAEAGDIVAVGPIAVDVDLVDEATQVTSMTGVPVFLARFKHMTVWGEDLRRDALRRLKLLQGVEASTSFGEVTDRLRARGITWYVWLGKTGPRFDPKRRKAIFADSNAAVYRVTGPSGP